MPEDRVILESDGDVVAAWRAGLALGRRLGFGPFKQACLSGAVLELSRNVVEHGRRGVCVVSDESDERSLRARIVIEGIASDAAEAVRRRLDAEVPIGPALPAVRLQQVVEACEFGADAAGARISLTISQLRASRPSSGRFMRQRLM